MYCRLAVNTQMLARVSHLLKVRTCVKATELNLSTVFFVSTCQVIVTRRWVRITFGRRQRWTRALSASSLLTLRRPSICWSGPLSSALMLRLAEHYVLHAFEHSSLFGLRGLL